MNSFLRAAITGLAIGTALFFVPFVLYFLFWAVVAGFIVRMVFRRRRPRYFAHRAQAAGAFHGDRYDAVSIDGSHWYRSDLKQRGASHDISID